ncbi:alkaline phosphatase family protein [Haloferax namakaokahaiae]|uniref:Alkaline phosphatase family protein n=1 Tax=Haloferax namakaokahaiae TaxID=1748331 RepID=A0ABD5ZCP4_9EURY
MKVCVVGLDGATWDLLDPWLDDLPTIKSFAEERRTTLDSCIPPLSMPAWKVYSTGMNPGDLGVFTFVEPDFEEERFKTVTNESFTTRELWDYLGEHGHKSAVVNMPTTYPPRDIDGWQISGPFSGKQEDYTRPAELGRTLDRNGYTILPDYYLSRDPDDIDEAVDSVETKLQTALGFTETADFVHTTLYLTDTVQHTEWDSPVCKSFWESVDEKLAWFLDQLGDDWNVVLMSDHGFGYTEGRFYLNTWLEQEGYIHIDDDGFDFGDLFGLVGLDYDRSLALMQKLRLSGLVLETLPESFLRKVARQMPGNRKLEGLQDKIDWEADAVALAPLIYTRNKAVADEIRSKLLEVTDRHGEKIIDEVYYGENVYPDADVRVPDLVIKHTDYGISDIVKPGVLFEYDGDWRHHNTAHHRRNGILTARGPDVEDVEFDEPRLYDLAPTILDGFGIDIPEGMRGESTGLLGSNSQRRDVPTDRNVERVVEHDAAVEEKLKNLGYL